MNRLSNVAFGCFAGLVAVGAYAWFNPMPTRQAGPTDPAQPIVKVADAQDSIDEALFDAPAFDLIDPDGKPFGSKDLMGKPYAVMFFFSECQGVCPGMTGRMKHLQSQVEGTDVQIVSFTVDPINDTPEKLAGHRAAIGADGTRWHLLTGTPEQMIAVAKGFNLPYDSPVNHSSAFLLVDRKSKVRGIYATGDLPQATDIDEAKDNMARLAADAKTLTQEKR